MQRLELETAILRCLDHLPHAVPTSLGRCDRNLFVEDNGNNRLIKFVKSVDRGCVWTPSK